MNNTTAQQLSRKERERLYKRQEIVNAAREVFAARGYTDATLDEIAERAEFGKGTLYSYFESKDELFDTVMADVLDEFVDIATQTCTAGERDVRTSYLDFARALLGHLFRNYGLYFLLMREMHRAQHQSHFLTMFPNLILILTDPLRRELSDERLGDNTPEQIAFMYLTMILSLFRGKLQILGQQHCHDVLSPLVLTEEVIQDSIDRSVTLLDQVFFNGFHSMTNKGH